MVQTADRSTASVKVKPTTWARLNARREAPGETLDSVIRRLLDLAERERAEEKAG